MLDRQHSALRPPRDESFVIGDWQIQPACNRMVHRGRSFEKKLEPRLMHLLCFLAANPGRTLNREILVAELWPSVIVTENSLTRAVSELRKHLGIAGGNGFPKIETVAKKGYRLDEKPQASESIWRRALSWPAFAIPVLAVALFAGSWIDKERGASPISPYRFEASTAGVAQEFMPVSSDGGDLSSTQRNAPMLSANGGYDAGGHSGIQREAPVLSADGSHYAFINHDTAGSTIWLGELRGGTEPVAVYNSSLPLTNLVWSPTGNALLFARQGAITAEAIYGGARSAQLMQLDLATWTVSMLVEEPEQPGKAIPAEVDLT